MPNTYITYCGINWRDESMERVDVVNSMYLKNEKGKPRKKDSPLLKNDITKILRPQRPVIAGITTSCLMFEG